MNGLKPDEVMDARLIINSKIEASVITIRVDNPCFLAKSFICHCSTFPKAPQKPKKAAMNSIIQTF